MTRDNFSKAYLTEPKQLSGVKRGLSKNPVWSISPSGTAQTYTRDGLKQFTQAISNMMKERYGADAGMIGTAVKYQMEGWRGGYMGSFGSNSRIHSFSDSDNCQIEDGDDEIIDFHLYYVRNGNSTSGGCITDNELNDCLYDCIKSILDTKMRLSPEQFKKRLGLKRTDKISKDQIPEIEKMINYKINLTGDYTKTSTFDSKQEMNIVLKKGHYTIQPIKRIINEHMRSGHPLIWEKHENKFRCWTGNEIITLNKERFYEFKNDMQGHYILIEKFHKKTLEESYEYFLQSKQALKTATKGKVDLSITGEYTTTALKLFNELNKVQTPEQILIDEAQWINNDTTGSIIFGDAYEGELFSYDCVSFYPSILRSTNLLIPISRGVFQNISAEEFNSMKYMQYGIYRCRINVIDYKLMRFNPLHYYTHIDISRARELGYDITLIEDDEPNFLYYSRDRTINASQAFRPFVDYVYKLKEDGVLGSKQIINCLWGVLCESMRMTIFHTEGSETFIDEHKPLISIKPYNKSEANYEIRLQAVNKTFKSDWARLKPFLLSKGRSIISKAIEPYKDHIKRSHTDSMYSDIKLDIETGSNIGELKYTGYCPNAKIRNSKLVIGHFN